jgi:hypothetical protein
MVRWGTVVPPLLSLKPGVAPVAWSRKIKLLPGIILHRYGGPVHRGSNKLAVSRIATLGSLVGLGFFVHSATFWRLVVLVISMSADNFGAKGGESSVSFLLPPP